MTLIQPVQARVTASYGIWPDDPVAQQAYKDLKLRGHNGIDYGVRYGTACKAACDAIVTKFDGPYTFYLKFTWDDGIEYEMVYAHCSKIVVVVGQRVKQGEVICYSGNEGGKFAAHLHWAIRKVKHPKGNDGFYWFENPARFFKGGFDMDASKIAEQITRVLGGDNPNPSKDVLANRAARIEAEDSLEGQATDLRNDAGWIRLPEHPELKNPDEVNAEVILATVPYQYEIENLKNTIDRLNSELKAAQQQHDSPANPDCKEAVTTALSNALDTYESNPWPLVAVWFGRLINVNRKGGA